MTKKIVICFDGTWNDPKDNTNVNKIFNSIDGQEVKLGQVVRDAQTIKWYDPGVGTRFLNKLRGGALGSGLSRNVQEGFRLLIENYETGDEIYLFGFSRGAYTARSLGGLIG